LITEIWIGANCGMSFSFAGTDSENAQVTLRDSMSGIVLFPAKRQAILG
jgi:hypothetical protein